MSLKPWNPGDAITATRLNAMQMASPQVQGGPGVVIGDANGTKTISTVRLGATPRWVFDVLIEDFGVVATNQWVYYCTEAIKTGPGYAGWETRPNGREIEAYNRCEIPNSSTGVQGNGIDLANLPVGFAVKPIASGVVVEVQARLVDDGEGGTLYEYWFACPNAVDGTCGGGA